MNQTIHDFGPIPLWPNLVIAAIVIFIIVFVLAHLLGRGENKDKQNKYNV